MVNLQFSFLQLPGPGNCSVRSIQAYFSRHNFGALRSWNTDGVLGLIPHFLLCNTGFMVQFLQRVWQYLTYLHCTNLEPSTGDLSPNTPAKTQVPAYFRCSHNTVYQKANIIKYTSGLPWEYVDKAQGIPEPAYGMGGGGGMCETLRIFLIWRKRDQKKCWFIYFTYTYMSFSIEKEGKTSLNLLKI